MANRNGQAKQRDGECSHAIRAARASVSVVWEGTLRERQSLHFFCVITAPELSGYLDGSFWRYLVLQASQHDAAIRHAVAAIGASHEYLLRKQAYRYNAETDALHPFALRQCNKAIKNLVKPTKGMTDTDIMRALTASILFFAFESLNGNRDAAIPHVIHSKRLVEQHARLLRHRPNRRRYKCYPVDIEVIRPLVAHYEVQIGDRSVGDVLEGQLEGHDFDKPIIIENLADARVPLEHAIGSLGVVIGDLGNAEYDEDLIADKRAEYGAWFLLWEQAFSSFLAKEQAGLDRASMNGCRLLKAHQTAAYIMSAVEHGKGEDAWARFTPEFDTITRLVDECLESMPKRGLHLNPPQSAYFSSSMGMMEPLYMTASRCAQPDIAERARLQLSKIPTNEGAQSSWRCSFVESVLCAVTGKQYDQAAHSYYEEDSPYVDS